MELLRELLRARALEERLARAEVDLRAAPVRVRPVSPAVPAVRALRRKPDGSGDVFSLRVGSPAAALAMGLDPRELLRQGLGRGTAPAGGRDPGGFPTDLSRGLLSPVDLPGILVEVMAGIALAFRLRGTPRVALVVDDLAGSASGDWHEGLNFAAVREVPMVVVVDHGPAGAPPVPVEPMGERAAAYGFAAFLVDGTDPRAVERVIREAVEAARRGGGLQVVDVESPAHDPVEWLMGQQTDGAEADRPGPGELAAEAEAEMEDALRAVADEPDADPAAALHSPDVPFVSAGPAPWAAPAP